MEASIEDVTSVVATISKLYLGDARMPLLNKMGSLLSDKIVEYHVSILLKYLLRSQESDREKFSNHTSLLYIVAHILNRYQDPGLKCILQSIISDAILQQVIDIEFKFISCF
jgi:hypothetical protein